MPWQSPRPRCGSLLEKKPARDGSTRSPLRRSSNAPAARSAIPFRSGPRAIMGQSSTSGVNAADTVCAHCRAAVIRPFLSPPSNRARRNGCAAVDWRLRKATRRGVRGQASGAVGGLPQRSDCFRGVRQSSNTAVWFHAIRAMRAAAAPTVHSERVCPAGDGGNAARRCRRRGLCPAGLSRPVAARQWPRWAAATPSRGPVRSLGSPPPPRYSTRAAERAGRGRVAGVF